MTVRTPSYLKTRFENGDEPTGTDFEDVFDSFLAVGVTSEQSIAGGISPVFVSASYAVLGAATITSATITNLRSTNVSCDQTVYASGASFVRVNTTDAHITSASITNAVVTQATITSASITNMRFSSSIVTAVGNTTALAAAISSYFTVGYSTSANAAYILPEMQTGEIKNIYMVGTTGARVYPASGRYFEGSAAGAPVAAPGNQLFTVTWSGSGYIGTRSAGLTS